MERRSNESHTVTNGHPDQNGKLLIIIWHLNATACNRKKVKGEASLSVLGGFVIYTQLSLTEGRREEGAKCTEKIPRPLLIIPSAHRCATGTGRLSEFGLGQGHEAAVTTLPDWGRGHIHQTVASVLFLEWDEFGNKENLCSGSLGWS